MLETDDDLAFKNVTVTANTTALNYYYITVVKNKYMAICSGTVNSKNTGATLHLFSGLPTYKPLNNQDMVAPAIAYNSQGAIVRIKSSEPTKLYFDIPIASIGVGFHLAYPR